MDHQGEGEAGSNYMEREAEGRPKGSGRTMCVGVHWESQRTDSRRTVSRFLQACMLSTYPWLFKHSFWSSARSHPECPQSCPLGQFPTSLSFSPGNGTVMPKEAVVRLSLGPQWHSRSPVPTLKSPVCLSTRHSLRFWPLPQSLPVSLIVGPCRRIGGNVLEAQQQAQTHCLCVFQICTAEYVPMHVDRDWDTVVSTRGANWCRGRCVHQWGCTEHMHMCIHINFM